MPTPLEIKFESTLSNLIGAKNFTRNRKKLTGLLDITPSALSQYEKGTARPRFEVLVKMAEVFGVSLDYLVFGRSEVAAVPEDYGPILRYIDVLLSNFAAKVDQRGHLMSRIGAVLAGQIGRAIDESSHRFNIPGGLLKDEEIMILEAYSTETMILSMNLHYDILQPAAEQEAAGRFLEVVGRNLSAGRSYRFLLPALVRERNWRDVATRYRNLLQQYCHSEQVVLDKCHFRITDAHVMSGSGFYHLDKRLLERDHGTLFAQISHLLSDDGWIGYVISPSPEPQGDVLMDSFHLQHGREAFEILWKKAQKA